MDLGGDRDKQRSREETPTPTADSDSQAAEESTSSKKLWLWVVGVVVAIGLLGGAAVLLMAANADQTQTAQTEQHSDEPWQAVFLTDGQVYFGHIMEIGDKTLTLENIYYLRVQQRIQPPEGEQNQQNQQPQVSLLKLGRSELHCPVDEMTINRDQVLFWEELKDESRVVEAINEYLKTDDVSKKCYEGTTNQQQQQQNQ